MSKRAEIAALKAYPKFSAENIEDVFNAQYFFEEGYEQAEKDTIERACEWLSRHYDIDLVRFRKIMEEEP